MLMIAKPAFRVNYQSLEAIVKKWMPSILGAVLIIGIGVVYAIQKDGVIGLMLMDLGIMLAASIILFYRISEPRNTQQNQPTQSKPRQPFYVAQDPEKFRVQQMLYWIVKSMREQGKSWKEITFYIQQNYPDFPSDKKTLLNALKAGEAGYLYSWNPESEASSKQEQATN